MKRTLALLLMLLATAASATATPAITAEHRADASDVYARAPGGEKTQWAPTGASSPLHARAVSRGESLEGTSPCGREAAKTSVAKRDWTYAAGNPLRYVDPTGRVYWDKIPREEQEAHDKKLRDQCAAGDQEACRAITAGQVLTGMQAAPVLAVVAVEAAPLVWEGTIGPAVEGAATFLRTLPVGLRVAYYAAGPALARFGQNVINFFDETGGLAPVGAPLSALERQVESRAVRAGERAVTTTVGELKPPSVARDIESELGGGWVGDLVDEMPVPSRRSAPPPSAYEVELLPDQKEPFILLNKTYSGSLPVPKRLPSGIEVESHHVLQQEWARANLSKYGWNQGLAPTITLEVGPGRAHSIVSGLQQQRRAARKAAGKGPWSSSLQEELRYAVDDLSAARFTAETINAVMTQQYKMLEHLKVPFQRIEVP